jgi:hypothetical protein
MSALVPVLEAKRTSARELNCLMRFASRATIRTRKDRIVSGFARRKGGE